MHVHREFLDRFGLRVRQNPSGGLGRKGIQRRIVFSGDGVDKRFRRLRQMRRTGRCCGHKGLLAGNDKRCCPAPPRRNKRYAIRRVTRRVVPSGIDGNEKRAGKRIKIFFSRKIGSFRRDAAKIPLAKCCFLPLAIRSDHIRSVRHAIHAIYRIPCYLQ